MGNELRKTRIENKYYPVSFLEEVFEHQLRVVHTKIQLLSWDEIVLQEITGIVRSGSYTADGTSSSRRNLNLTFSVKDREGKFVQEYLTPDKKIKLFIGLENMTDKYPEEDIIWFNMGIFILTEPSFAHGVQEMIVSFSAQDKMSLMNGVIGGALPAPYSFVERINGKNKSFSWRDIFMSAATVIGNENPARVVVDSVPDYIYDYSQVKDISGLHEDFIFIDAPPSLEGERIVVEAYDPSMAETDLKKKVLFSKGDKLNKLRKFSPPDPIIGDNNTQEAYQKNVGEPITAIFQDIVEALSNTHEYFYTREGDLMLQPIQNFVNTAFSPTEDEELGYFAYELDMEDFAPNYLGLPFTYNFADKETVVKYANNSSFINLKNDFVLTSEQTGAILEIAIDHKPSIREITDWFIAINKDYNMDSPEMKFLQKDGVKRAPYNPKTNTVPFEYKEASGGQKPRYVDVPLDRIPWQIGWGLKAYFIRNIFGGGSQREIPRWGKECESMIFKYVADKEREKLIPNMGIFNPSRVFDGSPWLAGYPTITGANTEDDAEELDKENPLFTAKGDSTFWSYFLDIIPTESKLGRFSIEMLGRRTVGTSSKMATTMFRENPRNLIVMTETEVQDFGGDVIKQDLRDRKVPYVIIRDMQDQLFTPIALKKESDKSPFASFIGDPKKLEPLRYNPNQGQYIYAGGKFDGGFDKNINEFNVVEDGRLFISAGTYMHPITKKKYQQGQDSSVLTGFANTNEITTYSFLAFIKDKGSRCPDSGTSKMFVNIKLNGNKWVYAKETKTEDRVEWAPFTLNPNEDVIVAILEQMVFEGGNGLPESASHAISEVHQLFNIRESEMENLFSSTGAVDLFSGVRKLIYQHTNTADVITISALPVYQLEPNTLIYVEDEASNIKGMFMITSYSIQLSTDGSPTMEISAIQTTTPL